MVSFTTFYILCVLLGSTIGCTSTDSSDSGSSGSTCQELYLSLFRLTDDKQLTPGTDNDTDGATIQRTSGLSGSLSKSCSRGQFYYSFSPECQQDVLTLEQILLDEKNTTEMINLARTLRDDPGVHPKTWFTALSMVSLQRDDLRGLWKPSPSQVFPQDFINSRAVEEAHQKENSVLRDDKECVVVDERFADDNVDRDLWYFREDVQMNSHHWFWHITYPSVPPSTTSTGYVPEHPDRRGELFYYVHHHMMARYNVERICNGLPPVSPVELRRDYLMEDLYYPHLNGSNSGITWRSRDTPLRMPDSVVMRGPDGRGLSYVLLNRTADSLNRLNAAIDNGYLETSRGRYYLRYPDGIDRLVDTAEASVFSQNLNYYGSMHSSGHILIALAHDPNNPDAIPTVMADSGVSMRDFIFYRWHAMIDDLFGRHKKLLPPYAVRKGENQLIWSNAVIDKVTIYTDNNGPINVLKTFWSHKKFNLSTGLGFDRDSKLAPLQLCVKHLDHEDFTYEIRMRSASTQTATIRIFLAPTTDANGQDLPLEKQRHLYYLLDVFSVQLEAGSNIIKRDSKASTLTIPWGEGLYNVEQETRKPFCGCGWPYHLLLPKGTESGMKFDLFVMATNHQEDASAYESDSSSSYCHAAPILCGIPKAKYPDLKPMGYPFDRVPFTVYEQKEENGKVTSIERPVANIDEYVRFVRNSFVTKLTIIHVNNLE